MKEADHIQGTECKLVASWMMSHRKQKMEEDVSCHDIEEKLRSETGSYMRQNRFLPLPMLMYNEGTSAGTHIMVFVSISSYIYLEWKEGRI